MATATMASEYALGYQGDQRRDRAEVLLTAMTNEQLMCCRLRHVFGRWCRHSSELAEANAVAEHEAGMWW